VHPQAAVCIAEDSAAACDRQGCGDSSISVPENAGKIDADASVRRRPGHAPADGVC